MIDEFSSLVTNCKNLGDDDLINLYRYYKNYEGECLAQNKSVPDMKQAGFDKLMEEINTRGLKPEDFYKILLEKWKEYLHRTRGGRHLLQVLGKDLTTEDEIQNHMEEIKTCVRGHDLYNIFYGPYKKQETSLLRKYMDLAPREDFQDILGAIEKIPFFENRKRT